jgi:hypothetical protein
MKNEPKQTQNKSNLSEGVKLMQNLYLHRIINEYLNCGFVKTKLFKANNHSSFIINHLKGKANSNPF